MLGLKFIKVQPTDYVLLYRRGEVVREGAGLAFFYYAPSASVVRIPMSSVDVPFIFEEVTSDFQAVSVQGQITYRISDPRKLAQMLDFSLGPAGRFYASEDPLKLPQRLVNHAQVLTRSVLKSMPLREALVSSDVVVERVRAGLERSEMVASLGLEILGLSIVAIKPTPETARALEAEAREQFGDAGGLLAQDAVPPGEEVGEGDAHAKSGAEVLEVGVVGEPAALVALPDGVHGEAGGNLFGRDAGAARPVVAGGGDVDAPKDVAKIEEESGDGGRLHVIFRLEYNLQVGCSRHATGCSRSRQEPT